MGYRALHAILRTEMPKSAPILNVVHSEVGLAVKDLQHEYLSACGFVTQSSLRWPSSRSE